MYPAGDGAKLRISLGLGYVLFHVSVKQVKQNETGETRLLINELIFKFL
jgi:hypothetical protein